MKYKDLSKIALDPYITDKSIDLLKQRGVSAPDSVIEQFYIDHNANSRFLTLYGDLSLPDLKWELVDFDTTKFLQIGSNASFPDFLEEVSEDASHFHDIGEAVIDCREEVLNHWKKHGTWLTPPIFLDANVLGGKSGIPHLVEGHSRVGCLLGIQKYKIIPLADRHKVYWGSIRKGT
ncbi:hypothetical protein [Vibrio parahaemolyticus]|uniref:hypothetical protein n=1 Tax=Vibrio parahaemolyticus TaxID=670 RepID=UPI0011216723|nr:hypothetical protein [Vibrio parahaemolyticus]MBE4489949.1 hypothetical protein [Vibrio parahaemolyticus]MBE4489954.1 hypothetical protein [Vibrio parahaemolyticus]MBE4494629.1 hypothetical protein [Vibrio parahaemolyticus]MBE4494635.1 hypothetical protein [Vibrio parahaemolyticus]MBE4503527.1 hypothetical protein [Vibrio parahaemolyticus]